jgi:hypothetical protein
MSGYIGQEVISSVSFVEGFLLLGEYLSRLARREKERMRVKGMLKGFSKVPRRLHTAGHPSSSLEN